MADTITQTPFQPLVPSNQLMNTAPPPVVPAIGADINPRLFTAPGTPDLDRIAEINRGADKAIEQQGAFWPNALAIGAMLTGNFGPMVQLEEQKRKTAIGQFATPYMMEATNLAHQGKFEEAQNVINNVSGKLGPRAPEVLQLFKPVMDKLSKDQTNWRDMQQVAEFAKMTIPDDAHPDAVNFRDFAQKAVKNRTVISSELLGSLFTKAIPHIQVLNGQVQRVGQLSGQLTQQPLANIQTTKEVGGPIGEFLSSRLGISIPEITDVLNLKQGMPPVQTAAGPVEFGSREYQYIVQAQQDSMALRASQSFQEKTPLEPSIATALRRDGGATQLQIATGTYTPQQIDAAVTADQGRKVGIASAAELAKIRQNPLIAEQSGLVNIDVNTGLPLRRGMSIDEIEKRGLNVVRLPVATFEARYRPAVEALTALDNLEPFIENLGNPQKIKERIASGFNRWASDRLGVALTKNIEVGKAFEVMLNNAIEEAAQRGGINQNDKDIRLIKTYTTGAGASPEAARRAVKEIQKRLSDRLYQESGEASLARPAQSTAPLVTAPAATPRATAPTTAPSAQQIPGVPTPNVRQVPAAGVTPGADYRQQGGGFAPSGTTTYTPPQRGKPGGPPPRNAAQRQAVEILKSTIPDEATAPAEPTQFVKPGTLR